MWCYGLATPIHSLGPGPRIGLWVTGCERACPGCQSQALQSKQAGWELPVSRVAQRLLLHNKDLCGLTLSGGEPFLQAPALTELLIQIKLERPHWNIIAFSGYYYHQLILEPSHKLLLEQIDLLIDGPFIRNLVPMYPLTGSGNQKLLALTDVGQVLRTQILTQPTPGGEWAQDHEYNNFWLGFPYTNLQTNVDEEW